MEQIEIKMRSGVGVAAYLASARHTRRKRRRPHVGRYHDR